MKSIKIQASLFLCLLIALCTVPANGQHLTGSKNVIKQTRSHTGFNAIYVEDAVDVYIAMGNTESVVVKADDNLVDIIETEVKGNTLYVSSTRSIRRAKSFSVYVTVKKLKRVEAQDGSDVYSLTQIKADQLELVLRGGSDIELDIMTNQLNCSLKGGSDANLKGEAKHFIAEARGGSDIEAKRLKVDKCDIEARGGSDASIYVLEELDVRAFGASDIHYSGNPKIVHEKAKGASDISH